MGLYDSSTSNDIIVTGTTTTSNTWYPYDTQTVPTGGWGIGDTQFPSYPPFREDNFEVADLKKEVEKLKKHLRKKEKKMSNTKTLYEIVVVDLDGKIVMDNFKVVASDKEEALFEGDVNAIIKQNGLSIKDVTVIVRELGQVKTRPETKRVIVEKD